MVADVFALALARGVQTGATLGALGTLFASAACVGRAPARQRRILWISVAAAWIAAPFWLVLQAGEMAGATELGAALRVAPLALYGSVFGRALLLRLMLLMLAACFGTSRHRVARAIALGAAALACLMQVRMGHAAAPEASWQPVMAGLHVLAAAVWIGGLPSLLAALDHDALHAARRFSPIGIGAVLVIVVTAVAQCLCLAGGLPGLLGTAYGHAVLLKAALFIVLLGCAALNRMVLTPRLGQPSGIVRLRWSVRVETVVGLCTIGVAAWLAAQAPGVHERPVWPLPWQLNLDALDDDEVAGQLHRTLLWLATGAAVGVVGAFWARRAPWRGAAVIAAGGAAMALAAPGLAGLTAPAYPTSFYESPTGFTPASVAAGATLYPRYCAECHGARGFGDGAQAATLPERPLPLTGFHVLARGDGEMFWFLSSGVRDATGRLVMPGFGDRLSEDERWDLIDFVRTLAGAEPGDNAPLHHHH